ncbi:MAG: hypothetical protein NT001_03035 [Candidatus Woesearchaeota archaeon]|nr:hypothetical protein [Candidatus Woesearchaeota archaeon]
MDKNILRIILGKRGQFVPLIFTEKQFDVMNRYFSGLKLSNADRKALYTSISKKMKALEALYMEQKKGEYYVYGSPDIIPSRLEEAKKLIGKYSEKYGRVFVSGSFLFSREFGDIDVFIIREKGYKEVTEKNIHIIFLTEKRLSAPVFQSASLISVSNFIIPRKIRKKRPSLSELMSIYHESVIEIMRNDKKSEALRNLIFYHSLFCENRLMNPKELKENSEKINISEIDLIVKELCRTLFSKDYLYIEIHEYIKTLKESINNIKPNEHLIRFKNTYEELIYGRQRSKAETA